MAKKEKGRKMKTEEIEQIKWTPHNPTTESERVVVDQIVADGTPTGTARLLRAKRLEKYANSTSLGIETWGEERECLIETWRVKAFVGFTSQLPVQEGDVFFVKTAPDFMRTMRPNH